MKIAIQSHFARGFWLPVEAIELYLKKKGINYTKILTECKANNKEHYDYIMEDGEPFYASLPRTIEARSEPELIETVEELGELLHSFEVGDYDIVEIPDKDIPNCYIGWDNGEHIYYQCNHCHLTQRHEDFKSQKWRRKV